LWKILKELDTRKKGTLKMYNPGLDRRAATHFFTLRDPCMGSWPRRWKPLFYDMNKTLLGMTWSAKRFSMRKLIFVFKQTQIALNQLTWCAKSQNKLFLGWKCFFFCVRRKHMWKENSKINVKLRLIKIIISLYID